MAPRRAIRDLEDLSQRFEDVFGWPFHSPLRRFGFQGEEWIPPIEMYEKDDKFAIRAELPGIKEEDIDISVSGNMLIIKGERKQETEVDEDDYYCCERSYGSFLRSIDLPLNADIDKIEANTDDGVLEVTIPKTGETKAKKISITGKKT
jgi:HSP20 family protein